MQVREAAAPDPIRGTKSEVRVMSDETWHLDRGFYPTL